MANWGTKDYVPDEQVEKDAEALRTHLAAQGKITEWPIHKYPVRPGYGYFEVQAHCVRDKRWQDVRLSMKGKPTHEKLEILIAWWERETRGITFTLSNPKPQKWLIVEIQVGNYLGALVRGGQLDKQRRIRKYL